MLKKFIIPCTVLDFQEGTNPEAIDTSNGMEYEPSKGEKIHVIFWVRYPSYDFIFGVPDVDNPKHEKELSFFQYRDTRLKKIFQGMYLDLEETKEMIEGFQKVLEFSKINSPHLWTIKTTTIE